MTHQLINLPIAPLKFCIRILGGIWTVFLVLASLAKSVFGKGSFKLRLLSKLAETSMQRRILTILRTFLPNLSLKRKLVKSYENDGTVIVTRRDDVIDVLSRDSDFAVVYGPRMRKLTDGENFFLGMQPGWDYTRDTSSMRLAARMSDVKDIVLPRAQENAEKIVSGANGRLDIPAQLSQHIPWDMTDHYFGVGGPSETDMQAWTTTLFWYLFSDLGADPELDKKAMTQAKALRNYLDKAVSTRKAKAKKRDDILSRCLDLQTADTPGMSDEGIRNNLLGLLIGTIPTISKASCLALDELLRRPDELAKAQIAARADNDELMANYIWEALRFNPHNPVIYRRATRDTVIAPSTLRGLKVKKGQIVFAANFSAMFDARKIPAPMQFRSDRTWETYIHWGYGMHRCFGDAINKAIIPAILKPILKQNNLRRANGETGEIDTGGTPFPQHFVVVFDT